jgi:long-subunit fatty acid transport protein
MSRFIRLSLALLLLSPVSAWAQQSFGVPLEFDFLNPGARNLGLAGVAGGLADDATAVLTNPAGLAILRRPEVSAEVRMKRVTYPFLSGGTLGGTLNYSEFSNTQTGLNFVSAVFPAGRVVVGAYRHEFARIELDGQRGLIFAGNSAFGVRDFNRTIDITTFGASLGVRVTDKFAIGASVSAAQIKAETTLTENPNVDGTGVGITIGAHVSPTNKVRLGAAYRKGAEVDIDDAGFEPGPLKVPDMFSAGLMIRPSDQFTVAVDVSRVTYSDLATFYYLDESLALIEVPDATEFHAAGEYVFTQSSLLPAIRAGVWFDPAHAPVVTGQRFVDPLRRQLAEAVYAPADDTVHFTGGMGLVIRSGFEVNVGLDVSRKAKLFSTSFIARF